jgi:hypothetical protein
VILYFLGIRFRFYLIYDQSESENAKVCERDLKIQSFVLFLEK